TPPQDDKRKSVCGELMKRSAIFIVLCLLSSFPLIAQEVQATKPPDKDADKKPAMTPAKKSGGKDEKQDKGKDKDKDKNNCKGGGQECPPHTEEKKGGMTADTFSGLKFRLIGPGAASGRVMS